MENSLLKLVLHEYEEKRERAALEAEQRKKDLLAVNPRLQEIENEISSLSIQTAKAMLNSNSKEQNALLSTLKNKTVVKYTLPEDNKNIFSSIYKLHLPTEQELIDAVEEEKKNLEK